MEHVPEDQELKDLERAYAQMAQDKQREREALDWAEATVGDVDRLASESSKLHPPFEKAMADEGMAEDARQWPEW